MKKEILNYEVTIVGGGVSGVVAAIAAARNGAKTLLINSSPVLGGNSSSEIRVWTRGSSGGGNIMAEEMGILGELKLRNQYINQSLNPFIWDEVLLEAVLDEENITLLLGTLVVSTKVRENRVESIEAFSVRGEVHYHIESNIFIDASGDGVVAAATSIPYIIGKESKDEYQEELAPDVPSKCTQGSSVLFFTEKKDYKVKFIPPSFAYPIEYIEKLINTDGRIVNETTNGLDFWWVEYGGNCDMLSKSNDIALELKKLVYGILNYIKNSGKFDADYLELDWVGNIPGKRETRRFKTDTVLTYNDIKDKKVFDDVAFYSGWFLDFHPEGGIYSKEKSCIQIPIGIFPVPLSTLYSSKVGNLLLCGRIIGTTHSSFSSSRVMNTCALSGQAAGIAASYLVKENKTTSCLKQDYNEVQKRLEDVLLIDKAAKDINQPTDFFVSSTISKVPGKECGSIKAEESEIFLTVPSEAIQNTSIVIDSEKDTNISIRVRKDILPHRFDIGYGKHKTVKLNKGRNIVSLSLFTVEEPSYLTLSFKASSLVSFPTLDENLPGFLMGNLNKPQYFNPFIILDDFSIYSKENLFNGYDRPYNGYNGWVSDQVECELKVKAKDFNQVNLYFDPSLERELVSSRQLKVHKSHMVDDIFSVANSLVKDFDLTVYKNNKPLETIEIRNNYQRLVKVNITEEGDSFAIKFLKTWNEKRIRLFSVEIINNK